MEKITLDHIGGYEYQKKEANKIVDFFKNYDTYSNKSLASSFFVVS